MAETPARAGSRSESRNVQRQQLSLRQNSGLRSRPTVQCERVTPEVLDVVSLSRGTFVGYCSSNREVG